MNNVNFYSVKDGSKLRVRVTQNKRGIRGRFSHPKDTCISSVAQATKRMAANGYYRTLKLAVQAAAPKPRFKLF